MILYLQNIHFDETIDIRVDNLYNDNENLPNIPKHDFRNSINIANKESLFTFNNKYYKQVDGVAMGSLLGPAITNIFMCSFESNWLQDCLNDFKPVFYRRYVDDLFVMFSSPNHAATFKEYKVGFIKLLLFRCFSLCSDFIKFHHEIDKLKSILYKNSYPRDLVDKCIKEILYKILAPKPVVSAVP